jgi:TRAP-type C4-dicarboxylate transport system substrate-binding protein
MLKLLKGTAVAGAAVVALTASATVSQAQEVTLRMHTFIPPVANPSKTFLIPWAERIGKESNGRIKVQPFWAMQLGGKVPQLLDQAKDGVVDIVWTLPGFTPGRMPRVEPFELPFVHKDALSSTLALQDFQEMHLGPDLKDYQTLLVHVPRVRKYAPLHAVACGCSRPWARPALAYPCRKFRKPCPRV